MTNYLLISLKHTKLISRHKWYVFKNCCHAGIPIRGLLHDLSKFSPTEFFESVKYFTGTGSPIDRCKKEKGFSKAWFHHRNLNTHHWEHWVDNFELGTTPVIMPYKDALEMICDFMGAGRAYEGKSWNFESLFKWWAKKKQRAIIHPVTAQFVDTILYKCYIENNYSYLSNKKRTKKLYKELIYRFKTNTLSNTYWCDQIEELEEL